MTDKLRAFLGGVGSLVDVVRPTLEVGVIIREGETDLDLIGGDFARVGGDLHRADQAWQVREHGKEGAGGSAAR